MTNEPTARVSVLDAAPSILSAGLIVGPLLALFAALARDASLAGVAAAEWIFSYGYCAPALARRMRRREPPQDHQLGAALLALAAAPWGLFILHGDVLTRPDVILWSAPAAMAPGALVAIATNLHWKRRTGAWRAILLVLGGLAYLGWIAAYVWLAAQGLAGPRTIPALGLDSGSFLIAAVFLAPVSFIALWMAVRLLVAPLQAAPAE